MVCTMHYAASMILLNQYFYPNVMHLLVKYCHSCALVGLFLDAYTLCVMHWLSVEHTSVLPCAC